MVYTRSLIFKSSSPNTNRLVSTPRAPVTVGITVSYKSQSFFSSFARSKYLTFSLSLNFTSGPSGPQRTLFSGFCLFFSHLSLRVVICPRLGNAFLSQNVSDYWALNSHGHILSCAHTFCSHGQIQTFRTFPSVSSFPLNHVLSNTPFGLIYGYYYYYYYYFALYLFKPVLTDDFSLESNIKSLQVFRTLLRILIDIICAVVWLV